MRAPTPRGAFYAFPNVTARASTADALAARLLDEAGVAVLSGTSFGAHGEGYLRLSYAAPQDQLAEALAAMRSLLESST